MYRRILIANRADCALELTDACHALNIEVFVISARDDVSPVLKSRADKLVFTGSGRGAYTAKNNILESARHYGCEAIMPGWGFLSEDFQFARQCRHLGIDFIGPKTQHLQWFGDKIKTTELLATVFDTPHPYVLCGDPDFERRVKSIRPPFMLKPRYGGGGKNIQRIADIGMLLEKCENLNRLGQGQQYFVEAALDSAQSRHLEFQVMGDGRRMDLIGARDCTPQRNHQKWLERSVCLENRPDICRLGETLCRRLASIGYLGWGTVECLVTADGRAHLLELNPRLQVEHMVTVTDSRYDLIGAAIRVACGCELPAFTRRCGTDHTYEFRLYARSAGRAETFAIPDPPSNGAVFSAFSAGDEVTGVYDGMLARLVLSGKDACALDDLRQWVSGLEIRGLADNRRDLASFSGFGEIPALL